mmetsp:Transcript_11978/g.38319  ORF Transcript_11978/g.38319 Transcript_11978/m.38319 type:complete len:169 (+) Transcript_11978:31-537(+)
MGKSIRSKIKRKFRAERRAERIEPVLDKRMDDALSRMQRHFVAGKSLSEARAALAGEGKVVEVVEEDVNKETRFSFAPERWKLRTPKYSMSLQELLEKQVECERKEREEAKAARAGGKERVDITESAAAGMDEEEPVAGLGMNSAASRSLRNLRKSRRPKKKKHMVEF